MQLPCPVAQNTAKDEEIQMKIIALKKERQENVETDNSEQTSNSSELITGVNVGTAEGLGTSSIADIGHNEATDNRTLQNAADKTKRVVTFGEDSIRYIPAIRRF